MLIIANVLQTKWLLTRLILQITETVGHTKLVNEYGGFIRCLIFSTNYWNIVMKTLHCHHLLKINRAHKSRMKPAIITYTFYQILPPIKHIKWEFQTEGKKIF